MAGEPDWMIDTALRRKRDELTRQWEERETRLQEIRAREKRMEEKGRGGKRQKLDDNGKLVRSRKKEMDEEAEFWIGDREDDEAGGAADDPLSLLSKDTRDLMAKVGLGRASEVEEEEAQEDEIKVRAPS